MFLEKVLANNCALLDAEGNTYRPLNREGITDLPLLRTLLAIRHKSREPSFLGSDGLFCFSSICKFDSFKNPFATITSLSELYFRFKDLFCWYKRKSDFYELWQQLKQLKPMEMSEV